MPSPRNISLDLVKAIGMVAIIAGHFSIGVQFVFSFHVPLFFIVGGYLFRQKSMAVEWWTDVKRLLFPYALTSLAILCWDSMYAIHSKDYSVIRERIVEIILGGGDFAGVYPIRRLWTNRSNMVLVSIDGMQTGL